MLPAVSMRIQMCTGLRRSLAETWPEARQAMVREKLDLLPLSLRALHNVELATLPIQRSDEGTEGYVWTDDLEG